jgi:putative addiction module component (TIGR02574 family)
VNKPVDAAVEAVLKLPKRDRQRALDKIVIAIDAEGDGIPQKKLDRLWAAEINRRVEAIERNPHAGRPWHEVVEELDRRAAAAPKKRSNATAAKKSRAR